MDPTSSGQEPSPAPLPRTLYHGTGRRAWESGITRDGLRPSPLGYTLTTDPEAARLFANDWDIPEADDEGVVVVIDLPEALIDRFVDLDSLADGEYCLREPIPPRFLHLDR